VADEAAGRLRVESALLGDLGHEVAIAFVDAVLELLPLFGREGRVIGIDISVPSALDEVLRVMAPGGRLFILINLYADNEYSLQWVDKLKVPVHMRSAAEYVSLLQQHGFDNVEWRQIPDDTPTPDDYKTKSFRSLDDLRAFKRKGALLVIASKPAC